MDPIVILYRILSYTNLAVLLGGAVLLSCKSLRGGADTRVLRTLAFILLMWGVTYVPACLHPLTAPGLHYQPLSPLTLILGNLYVIICMLYPLELIRPGWIAGRRVGLLLLPYACVVGVYLLGLALTGEPVRRLNDATGLILHFSEFNVWYRFVLYLSVCFYIAYLFINTSIRASELRHRQGGRSQADRKFIRRLNLYGIGIIGITAAYLAVLFSGSVASLLFHRLVVLCFFLYAIRRTAFGRPAALPAGNPSGV